MRKHLGVVNSKKVVKIRVRCLHNKESSQETVLRKVSPFPLIQSCFVILVGPKPNTIKCHPCMCGVSVCLYAPTLGRGGRGKAHIIYLGMSLYYASTGMKKRLQKNSHAQFVFAFSVILPIHGPQSGVVSAAKEPQTLKHRQEQ